MTCECVQSSRRWDGRGCPLLHGRGGDVHCCMGGAGMSTAAREGRGCPLLHGRGRDVHMWNISLCVLVHAECLHYIAFGLMLIGNTYVLYCYLTIVLTTSKTPGVHHCMDVCACWLGSHYPI